MALEIGRRDVSLWTRHRSPFLTSPIVQNINLEVRPMRCVVLSHVLCTVGLCYHTCQVTYVT